jgi:hypothetical protein
LATFFFYLYQGSNSDSLESIHMLDDRVAKLRAFDLGRAIHQPGKIISDGFGCNRAFYALLPQKISAPALLYFFYFQLLKPRGGTQMKRVKLWQLLHQ